MLVVLISLADSKQATRKRKEFVEKKSESTSTCCTSIKYALLYSAELTLLSADSLSVVRLTEIHFRPLIKLYTLNISVSCLTFHLCLISLLFFFPIEKSARQ